MYNNDSDAIHIHAISSRPRKYGRQVNISKTLSEIKADKYDTRFDAKNEINTKADTICADANWRLLSASGLL